MAEKNYKFDIEVVYTLKKVVKDISVPADEIEYCGDIDTSDVDWKAKYLYQKHDLTSLLDLLKKLIKEDIENADNELDKKTLTYILDDVNGWEVEEFEACAI
jgi:hypothetical protein